MRGGEPSHTKEEVNNFKKLKEEGPPLSLSARLHPSIRHFDRIYYKIEKKKKKEVGGEEKEGPTAFHIMYKGESSPAAASVPLLSLSL